MFAVKIKNLKIPKHHTFFEKTLVLSIICSSCDNKDEKIFKEESIEVLNFLGLSNKLEKYHKNITKENISQQFRLKEIDEKRNYLIEEIKQNELISQEAQKNLQDFKLY